ncbi:MAG TPA: PAS domain-containing sensor histidine kinase [Burkholderiales bacterium]|jgi:two-component system sensor histidine kinase UhpB|nr:PAS domain-containing sensor histidine kinase [Burkholderiales bacterium]
MNTPTASGSPRRERPVWLHPASLTAAVVALAGIVALNAVAFSHGQGAPWLVAVSLIVDMLAVAVGIGVAVRQAFLAEEKRQRAEWISTQAQAVLQEKEARLAAIVDSAMDAIITVDENQRIVLFNRSAEQVFRCKRDQVLGAALDRLIPSRFREAHRTHIEIFGRTGVTNRRMGDATKLWGLRADGEEFPIEASISQVAEGGHRFYTVILRDVTLRDRYENELRRQQSELRALSAQVQEAREEEKTRIARELHDELGQLLTALKMDLGWLSGHLPASDEALSVRLRRMTQTLDQTVSSVRRIAADLRPLMLDDLGLSDAAAWLVEDFSQRSGIQGHLHCPDEQALNDLDRSVANTVYRALQESLTNVARHAQARNTWVVLAAENGGILLEVEDDGRGIAPGDLAKAKSLGLKGMRERALHLGGTFEVAPAPRGGTRVTLRVPLRPQAAGNPA